MASTRGEVTFKASEAGPFKGQEFKLRLRTNELIDLAQAFDCKTSELQETIKRKSENGFGLDDVRKILQVAIARHSPATAGDEKQVGDLMDDIGEQAAPGVSTLQASLNLILRMFKAGTEGPEGAEHPAQPEGTGPNA